jgi:HEAT repeat protein
MVYWCQMTRIALWLARYQLKSKTPAKRLRALKKFRVALNDAVVSLDDKITIALLDHVLSDSEVEIRREAAATLGDLRDTRVLPPLLRALNDRADAVQETAIQSLKRLDDRNAVDAIVLKLLHGSKTVRWRAAQTLKSLGWQPKTTDEQIRFLTATGELERLAVFGPAAIGALTEAFAAGTPEQRISAVKVLGEIADPAGFKPLQSALRDNDPLLRTAAIYALARAGCHAAAPAITAALRDSERNVRLAAAGALASLGDTQAVDPLIKLLNDKDWEVRSAALESLGRLGDTRAFQSVAKHLDDADQEVREVAAEALGRVGDETIVEKLVLTLVDGHSGVRMAAARALAKIDPDWETSDRVQRLLPDIQAAMKNKDAGIQSAAAALLRRVSVASPADPAALSAPARNDAERKQRLVTEALRELLRHPHPGLRLAAAETVGRLQLAPCADALKAVLTDPDPRVGLAAQNSLAVLASGAPAGKSNITFLAKAEPAAPGTAPSSLEDVLIYSALGEILHHHQCRDLAGWLKISDYISQKGETLAQASALGNFRRLEIVTADSNILVVAAPEHGAMIRINSASAASSVVDAKKSATPVPGAGDEAKALVTDWLRGTPSVRGVLVRGVRFADHTIVCDLDSRDLPALVLEQIYHAVSDTFTLLANHQLAANRLLWTCERAGLHCARRADRTIFGAFVLAKTADIDLPALDRQLTAFAELKSV